MRSKKTTSCYRKSRTSKLESKWLMDGWLKSLLEAQVYATLPADDLTRNAGVWYLAYAVLVILSALSMLGQS